MMRGKARVRRALPWVVTLIGVVGLLAGVAAPVAAQPNRRQSVEQAAELEEAKRLGEQADQLYNQGQYAAAIPLAEKALAIFEKVLPPEHPNVATTLNNLAALYDALGNYQKAEPLYQRALAICEKVLGLEHPNVALTLNNLAKLYRAQGNYTKAEPLYQRALAIFEKTLGPDHPNVATSLDNLAGLYLVQGKYSKAEPLQQRALAIFERVLGPGHPSVATSLNNLAALYRAQGNNQKAEALYQRALAICEKVLGPDHPSVATSLNSLGSLYFDQGNNQKAEALYQRALAILEKVLGPEHPDVASTLNDLASLYQDQGEYPKAEALYQRALAIREKVLGPDHPNVAASLNGLAQLYQDQGNYQKAEPLFQRALAIREKVFRSEHPDVAYSLNNLASLYLDQGNYSKAEPLYQRALAILEKVLGPEHPDVASTLGGLASLYQDQGNYPKAEPLFQRAFAIQEKVLGLEHLDVASTLNNLAALYQQLGNYQKAEALFQRALAIREKVLGPEHPRVALSLNNLAELYRVQGNYLKAEPLYQRALTIREKLLGLEHPRVATSLNNLALLYQDQGNYQKAEALYQRALAILDKVLGPNHPNVSYSLNNLAEIYRLLGKYQKAEPLFQRALTIREKLLGLEHPRVATSLNNLASLYYAQGDIARAMEFLSRGTNIEERNLALIFTTGSEAQKSAYIATLSGTTYYTVSLNLQDAPNNSQAAHLAFTTLMQRKGRVLDAVTDSLQTLRQRLNPEDQKQLDELAAIRSQLATLIFQEAENIPPDEYRKQVATLKAKADELENTLSRRSAEFRTESQPVTMEAVQQLIPADAALVELLLYLPFNPKAAKPNEKWGNPRYAAYVLHSQGGLKWVDLGEAKPINQAVADFRKALQNQYSDVKPVARALDEKLMQPIRKLLGNTRTVLLSPDSQLNLIPFAALVDENNRYLVENYSITYLSSGRDLLRLQNHAKSRSAPVLIANPDYSNPGDSSVQIAGRGGFSQNGDTQTIDLSSKPTQSRSTDNRRSNDFANLKFGSLPGTAQEAQAIAPILPGVKLLTGSQATENALKQLQAPSLLHIATHGFFLEDVERIAPPDYSFNLSSRSIFEVMPVQDNRPAPINNTYSSNKENPLLRSGLALAGINLRKSGTEDGVLTALEAAGLNLRGTKLVVLSACETGVGDIANGEGVYGLRRALAIAGAESQLISLWKVNDLGTKDLMVSYYKHLMNNVGRSEAVRQTQLEMLQHPKYQHPYYWAAFIPSGDWSAMESASP